MCTTKCGGLEPVDGHKGDLAKQCTSTDFDWLKIWKFVTEDVVEWFKTASPTDDVKPYEGAAETPLCTRQPWTPSRSSTSRNSCA